MRILIADDDVTSRTVLVALLSKAGYHVIATENGAEAWEILKGSDSPSLVMLDWVMPGLDGIEVVRRVRALATDRAPYIIMLTARTEKADLIAGLEAGADDYLTKPFDAGELRARLAVGRRLVEAQAALADKVAELRQALDQIDTLRGIVPICSHCKKVRDDQGFWDHVEEFVSRRSEAQFSHGICPDCLTKLYPDYV